MLTANPPGPSSFPATDQSNAAEVKEAEGLADHSFCLDEVPEHFRGRSLHIAVILMDRKSGTEWIWPPNHKTLRWKRGHFQGSREQGKEVLGAGEMVQWVKGMLSKCEDLNSIPKTQVKKSWT